MQCPTLYNVGFGAHRIEGIGDKHVTWIHNVWATDLLVCVDDLECLEGLQLLQEGSAILEAEGVEAERARSWVDFFGISGVCNVLAAIRAAAHYGLSSRQAVVTLATDGFDRYPSVLQTARRRAGEDGRREGARSALRSSVPGVPAGSSRPHPRCAAAGTTRSTSPGSSSRARASPSCGRRRTRRWWLAEQERAHEIDRRIRERRA